MNAANKNCNFLLNLNYSLWNSNSIIYKYHEWNTSKLEWSTKECNSDGAGRGRINKNLWATQGT